MHQRPAHSQHRRGILWHEQEGFDQIRDKGLALADMLPALAEAEIIVHEEHQRHDARENPPERIDTCDAGEQEIEAGPDAGFHTFGHIDHDETRDYKEQIHTGIAVRNDAIQKGKLLQIILANGQNFHCADMVDNDQQCRHTAQDLDGLKFHAVL